MSEPRADRPVDDDAYFEELSRTVFGSGLSPEVLDAKWPAYRRAFSKFNVKDVSDYTPDDVDRLMENPGLIRNLQRIEATIENAAEMLLVQIEYGSFGEYVDSFESPESLAEDITRRFRQISPAAAAAFIERTGGPPVAA